MAKSGEFYTFDEVVRQLKIDENKLKRLVSEGEISAFREGDVMKFKKTEIDRLATKGGSETSETVLSEITLEDEAPAFEESGETLTDDLVFESSETGDEVDLGADAGLATEEISSQDTFIEKGGDVGMSTEPIDLSADLTQEVEEEVEEVSATRGRPTTSRSTVRRDAQAPAGNPGITFALVLGFICLIFGFLLQYRTGLNETYNDKPMLEDGMFRKLAGVFYDNMGTQKIVKDAIDKTVGGMRSATAGSR